MTYLPPLLPLSFLCFSFCLSFLPSLSPFIDFPTYLHSNLSTLFIPQYDTRYGSGGFGFQAGGVPPGPQFPFGVARLSPDSIDSSGLWLSFNHFGGYNYADESIICFSHTHMMGSGVEDLGNFGVMSVGESIGSGSTLFSGSGRQYRSTVDKSTEIAIPGYYSIYLSGWKVKVELTSLGDQASYHKYTYDTRTMCGSLTDNNENTYTPSPSSSIIFDMCHSNDKRSSCKYAEVNISPYTYSTQENYDINYYVVEGTLLYGGGLTGRDPKYGGLHMYFYAIVTYSWEDNSTISTTDNNIDGDTDEPPSPSYGIWLNNVVYPIPSSPSPSPSYNTTTGSLGAYIDFGCTTTSTLVVEVKVGISFINDTMAKNNLIWQGNEENWYLNEEEMRGRGMEINVEEIVGKYMKKREGHNNDNNNNNNNNVLSLSNNKDNSFNPHSLFSLKSFSLAVSVCQYHWYFYLSHLTVPLPLTFPSHLPYRKQLFSLYYNTLLAPSTYTEYGGLYLGFDYVVHQYPYNHTYLMGLYQQQLESSSSSSPPFSLDPYNPPSPYSYGNFTFPLTSRFLSDMSLWDTHRTQFPLLSLLSPHIAIDITRSFYTMYQEGGDIPRWPLANIYTGAMEGSHGLISAVEFILKSYNSLVIGGLEDGNETMSRNLYQIDVFGEYYSQIISMLNGDRPHGGKEHYNDYIHYGYIPSDTDHRGSCLTLEYAYDDDAGSRLALFIGDDTTHRELYNRSQFYRHIYSEGNAVFCPKTSTGQWKCENTWNTLLPYPVNNGDFTEANPLQMAWFVPHDVHGLISVWNGGDDGDKGRRVAETLNLFINKSFEWIFPHEELPNIGYWSGNEPSIFASWIFNYIYSYYNDTNNTSTLHNYDYLTQYYTREILLHRYSSTNLQYSLPGNDDYGTLSAWGVYALIGLYPQAGSTTYTVTAPWLEYVEMRRAMVWGGDVGMRMGNGSEEMRENRFVGEWTVEGERRVGSMIDYTEMDYRYYQSNKGESNNPNSVLMEFTMSSEPAVGSAPWPTGLGSWEREMKTERKEWEEMVGEEGEGKREREGRREMGRGKMEKEVEKWRMEREGDKEL